MNPEFRYFISIIETFVLLTAGFTLLSLPLCLVVPFPLLLSAILFSLFIAVQLLPRRLKEDAFLRSGKLISTIELQQAAARNEFPEPVVRLLDSDLPLLFSLPGEVYVSRQLRDYLPATALHPLLLRKLYLSVRAGSGMRLLISRLRQLIRRIKQLPTPNALNCWLHPLIILLDRWLRFSATPMISRAAFLADRFALVDCGHPDQLLTALVSELAAVCRRDTTEFKQITLLEEMSDVSSEDVQDLLWSLNAAQRDHLETVVTFLLQSRATRRLLGDDGWRGMHPGERIMMISRWAARQGESISLPLTQPARDLDSLVIMELFQHLPLLALLITVPLLYIRGLTPLLAGISLLFIMFSLQLRNLYRDGYGRIPILTTSADLRKRAELGRTRGIPVMIKPGRLLPATENLPDQIHCLLVDESGRLPVSCPGLRLKEAVSCPSDTILTGIFRREPSPRLELIKLSGLAGVAAGNCHQNRKRIQILLAGTGIILILIHLL